PYTTLFRSGRPPPESALDHPPGGKATPRSRTAPKRPSPRTNPYVGTVKGDFLLLAPVGADPSMKNVLRLFVTLALLASPMAAEVMAHPVRGPPPCWPPPCIPIDGGLSLLVAAGALLGGKQAFDLRRSRKRPG